MKTQTIRHKESDLILAGATLSDIEAAVLSGTPVIQLTGLSPVSIAYVVGRISSDIRRPQLLICPTEREASLYIERVRFFLGCPPEDAVLTFKSRLFQIPSIIKESHVYSGSHIRSVRRRVEALYTLATLHEPRVFVSSGSALIEKAIPKMVLLDHTEYFVEGENVNRDSLIRRLVRRGYYFTTLVEEPGDASVRGAILDVYPPLYEYPVRLEFFGDIIESIRLFNPVNQKSVGAIEDVIILPANEIILDEERRERGWRGLLDSLRHHNVKVASQHHWFGKFQDGNHFTGIEKMMGLFYKDPGTVLDYLPKDVLVVMVDPEDISRNTRDKFEKEKRNHEKSIYEEEWTPPHELYLTDPDRIISGLKSWQIMRVGISIPEEAGREGPVEIRVETKDNQDLVDVFRDAQSRERFLEPLAVRIQEFRDLGIRSFLVCGTPEQAKRMSSLLGGYDINTEYTQEPFGEVSWESAITKVIVGHLDRGFCWPAERIAIIAEEEILGTKTRRPGKKRIDGAFLSSFQDLAPGDFIVHIDHGIGVYRGIDHITVDGIGSDFLVLEYQNHDKLYLPVDRIQQVQKYIGVDDQPPRLDRLGGKSWENSKRRAEESIRKMAEELLQIYALRKIKEGYSFSPPDTLFREFEAMFPFEETPDQLEAIADVLADMADPRPMDRLICGDVGFGKTEVAIRAAFKAVVDGKQVAMLVPTTILAEQHYQTFRERFAKYPVFVEVLSRFKTPAQQKKIIGDVQAGKVDIVIGTHRLLQGDVEFRDLGLLIIDEEHRFGVRHKEKLKKLRACVDVLSLSATPIPRTLHMSLMGIRDLSTIETPPQERYRVETFICKFDEESIVSAIQREIKRNGQVFFVHNRVKTIYNMATFLKKLVPEARIAVAHGQMPEKELENVMGRFVRKEIDVLVCSTIIESGLDIPTANTIIINRADKFGLAQIYQLRGRVGRADRQAYAYLLIPGKHLITRQAERRLRALLDFSELGSGFKIALNDLQIRGGGNLLGAAQSGHVAAIGYELYVELIQKTIRKLKGEIVEESPEPEIHLKLSSYLPESYIPDTNQRLLLYKRLASSRTREELRQIAREIRDRFGKLTEEVKNLINVSLIKQWLRTLFVTKLNQNDNQFVLSFSEKTPLDPNTVFEMMKKFPKQIMFGSDKKLIIRSINGEPEKNFEFLKLVLQKLAAGVRSRERNERNE